MSNMVSKQRVEWVESFLKSQWERIPPVPHAQAGSYDRGYQNGIADVLRGLQKAMERRPDETAAHRACDGCGLPATAACPYCDTPTCGKCANCEHALQEPSAGEAALQRVIDRHVRWRETAIGFLRQVIDGRGSEDEWPTLADFLGRSDSRMVESSSMEASGEHNAL